VSAADARPRWLLFDLDGVLLPAADLTADLRREHGITREQLGELVTTCFDACLVGAADLAEELPPFLERWGFAGSPRDFLRAVFAGQREPDPHLLETAADLRRSGVRCGVASNQERWRAEHLELSLELPQRFDAVCFSCRLGAKKPDPGFYYAVERRLGERGEAILFWDDQEANVLAARERGWLAERYTDRAAFDAALTRHLG